MGGYGYPTYRAISSYNTLREEPRGPVIRPFVPKNTNNSSNNSEAYVTNKTIVPVGSRAYGDDDNYKNTRSSATMSSYPTRDEDEWRRRQTNLDRDSPDKFNEFLTKVHNEASRSPPSRFTPVSSTDWRQKSPKPTPYYNTNNNGANNGYGDYGNSNYGNKEVIKPIESTIGNDSYGSGYNNYNNKDGDNGTGNGYGGYNTTGKDNYDGYNGYGGEYGNREGHKPTGSYNRNDSYDGNDYGNHDRHQPSENYIGMEPNYKTNPAAGWNRPKIGSAWTAAPRKGTQLSEPINDIGKALGMLKEAAKVTSNGNGHSKGNGSEPTSKVGKTMDLVKEAEKLKKIVTGPPKSSTTNYRDDNGETTDSREGTKRYGNFNLPSRPRHVTFIDGRDDDYSYGEKIDRSVPVSTIDSINAEKKFRGMRI